MDIEELTPKITEENNLITKIRLEIGKLIVGQKNMVESLLMGIFTNGHILLEGVPGLAKTTTVKAVADALALDFKRIQFTPDLLPADLLGTQIYLPKEGTFQTRKGPVFGNIILADEINRAPAKVQSALLEAMQEHQVTIGENTYLLPEPFLVLATQNPIEQEGTYTLPEAQADRFMFKIKVGYPSKEEEKEIVRKIAVPEKKTINKVITAEDIFRIRSLIEQIYIDEKLIDYIIELVFATRDPKAFKLPLANLIDFGASPRASIYLTKAAKAKAFLSNRAYVTPNDILSVAFDILRHRILLTYEAEAENISVEQVIGRIFERIEVP